MLLPAASISRLLTVLLLLIPAEKAGAPMLIVLPLLVMLTAPVADRLDCAGTEKLYDWPAAEEMVIAPLAFRAAVPLVYVVPPAARAIPPPGAAADSDNVSPLLALAVVPLRFVKLRVGLPCEWLLAA